MSGNIGKRFLALDFGASSGRAILGTLADGRLAIEETHRFRNDPVSFPEGLTWDLPFQLAQIIEGLRKSAKIGRIDSVAIDTWGVDFAFIDNTGRVLGNPTHYRDSRTDGVMEKAFAMMPRSDIFRHTGLAFMQFNTLYQLLSMKDSPVLSVADKLLFMPDLLVFLLTGEIGAEYTIASTSQLLNPITRDWSKEILGAFSLNPDWFPKLSQPGTVRGNIRRALLNEAGVAYDIPAALAASHDTASAVCAVPSEDGVTSAYISSGTWSLLGVLLDKPILTDAVLAGSYTNEGGAFGKTRLLTNIMGLWILQECRRKWRGQGVADSFAELAAKAEREPAFRMFFDPDAPEFLPPGDMEERIRAYARQTNQTPPSSVYGFARVIYENLALKYRHALTKLEREIIMKKVDALHIVGGGSNNNLLNRMTANALGIPVYAGPSEATAIGSIAMQAVASGELAGESDVRAMVRASFAPTLFMPQDTSAWDDAYGRFLSATGLC
ncbi:MAG: rhamnulokinase [Oscillospiraceae bacterium]|jgi:sugar (pentulose or hexulose) kinase|nr:rhamnulokinase [Oscillospiraceae bacterium]